MGRLIDEHVIEHGNRAIGWLGPKASTLTLAWLASHRDRLRTLLLGGHRLSILIVWDTEGQKLVERSEQEIAAIATIVYGPPD